MFIISVLSSLIHSSIWNTSFILTPSSSILTPSPSTLPFFLTTLLIHPSSFDLQLVNKSFDSLINQFFNPIIIRSINSLINILFDQYIIWLILWSNNYFISQFFDLFILWSINLWFTNSLIHPSHLTDQPCLRFPHHLIMIWFYETFIRQTFDQTIL